MAKPRSNSRWISRNAVKYTATSPLPKWKKKNLKPKLKKPNANLLAKCLIMEILLKKFPL